MSAHRQEPWTLLDVAMLKVDPLLLDIAEDTFEPQRFLDSLLGWSAGRLGYAEAAERYLRRQAWSCAARCVEQMEDEAARAQHAQRLAAAWQSARAVWEGELKRLTKGYDALRAIDLGALTGDLSTFLEEARGHLVCLPGVNEKHLVRALKDVEPGHLHHLQEALDFAGMAFEDARREIERRKHEQQQRLREIKREADTVAEDLLFREELDDAERQSITVFQQQLLVLVSRRDLVGAQSALAKLKGIQAGEEISDPLLSLMNPQAAMPLPPASDGPGPAQRWRRLVPAGLSQLARTLLGEARPADTREVLPQLGPLSTLPWEWDKEKLAARSEAVRAQASAGREDMAWALSELLMAEAKLRLLDGRALQAIALFIDAFRVGCAMPGPDAAEQRDVAASGVLLASWLAYAPREERAHDMDPRRLTTALQQQVDIELLPRLDARRLLPGQVEIAVTMGSDDGVLYLNDYLLPYLTAHPRAVYSFLPRLTATIDHLEDRSERAGVALMLAVSLLHPLLPGFPPATDPDVRGILAAAQRARDQQVRAQLKAPVLRLRGLVLPFATQHDIAAFAAELLEQTAARLDQPIEEAALDQRLLTPQVALGKRARVVVELALPERARQLRDLQAETDLLDSDDRSVDGALEVLPLLPRLSPGERREIPIALARSDLPRQAKLRVRWLSSSLQGVLKAVEVRGVTMSLAFTDPPAREVPPESPYVIGGSVQAPSRIYGRGQEVDDIRRALVGEQQDNLVLVLGERRIGKSTLLNAIAQRREFTERYLVLREDLQKYRHERSLVNVLRAGLVPRVRACLREAGITPPPLHQARFQENPGAAMEEFLREVDKALLAQDRRLLWILDELDQLLENDVFGDQAVSILRAVILECKRVSFLLAGATEILYRHTATREGRLFRSGLEVRLKPLETSAARQLVQEPAETYYGFAAAAVDLILRETNRQPYMIQRVCAALFHPMIERGVLTVTATDVEEILEREIVPRREVFYDFFASLPSEDLLLVKALAALQLGNRYVSLAALGRELQRMGTSVKEDDLGERLGRLTAQAPLVIEERLKTGWHRLRVGLFARHLRYRG